MKMKTFYKYLSFNILIQNKKRRKKKLRVVGGAECVEELLTPHLHIFFIVRWLWNGILCLHLCHHGLHLRISRCQNV